VSSRIMGLSASGSILVLIFAGSSVMMTLFFSFDVVVEVVLSPPASAETKDVECLFDPALVAARILCLRDDRKRLNTVSGVCGSSGVGWEYGWRAGKDRRGLLKRLRLVPDTLEEAVASLRILDATLCLTSFFSVLERTTRDNGGTTVSDSQAGTGRPTVRSSCAGGMGLKTEPPAPIFASLSQLRTPDEGLTSREGGWDSCNSVLFVSSRSLSLGTSGSLDRVSPEGSTSPPIAPTNQSMSS